ASASAAIFSRKRTSSGSSFSAGRTAAFLRVAMVQASHPAFGAATKTPPHGSSGWDHPGGGDADAGAMANGVRRAGERPRGGAEALQPRDPEGHRLHGSPGGHHPAGGHRRARRGDQGAG